MRYPVLLLLLLALPFLSAAQDFNWGNCSYQCLTADSLSKCQADPSCICTLNEGNYWPQLLICLQQNCPTFVTQYKEQLDNFCTLQGPPLPPITTTTTGTYGKNITTTTTTMTTLSSNKTVSSTEYSTGTKTTLSPSKTPSEGGTITTKSPTTTEATAPTSTAAAAAVFLEGAIKWPLTIALGLAGVAAL